MLACWLCLGRPPQHNTLAHNSTIHAHHTLDCARAGDRNHAGSYSAVGGGGHGKCSDVCLAPREPTCRTRRSGVPSSQGEPTGHSLALDAKQASSEIDCVQSAMLFAAQAGQGQPPARGRHGKLASCVDFFSPPALLATRAACALTRSFSHQASKGTASLLASECRGAP